MGGCSRGWFLVSAAALLVVSVAAQGSSGGLPSCATKLVPCAEYLNGTTNVPPSCCNPMKEAITKEKPCLCGILNNPSLIQSFGLNVTQILALPKLCNIDVGKDPTALCKAVAQSPSSPASGGASSSSTPSTPASGTPSKSGSASGDKNGATTNKFTPAGLLASLAAFCAYVVFY